MTTTALSGERTISAVFELISDFINPELTIDGGDLPLDQPENIFPLMAMSLIAITDGLMAIADEHGVPLEELLHITKEVGVDRLRFYVKQQGIDLDEGTVEVEA
jgi:hypothetical protein